MYSIFALIGRRGRHVVHLAMVPLGFACPIFTLVSASTRRGDSIVSRKVETVPTQGLGGKHDKLIILLLHDLQVYESSPAVRACSFEILRSSGGDVFSFKNALIDVSMQPNDKVLGTVRGNNHRRHEPE